MVPIAMTELASPTQRMRASNEGQAHEGGLPAKEGRGAQGDLVKDAHHHNIVAAQLAVVAPVHRRAVAISEGSARAPHVPLEREQRHVGREERVVEQAVLTSPACVRALSENAIRDSMTKN